MKRGAILREAWRDNNLKPGELVTAIAREFVVPAHMLRVEGPTNFQITIPERTGYVSWGPTTAEQLR